MKPDKTPLFAQITWIVLLTAGLAELYFGMSDLNKTLTAVPEAFEETVEAMGSTDLYRNSLLMGIGRIVLGVAMVLVALFRAKLNQKLLAVFGFILFATTFPLFWLIDDTATVFYYLGFTRALSLIAYNALFFFFKKGHYTA